MKELGILIDNTVNETHNDMSKVISNWEDLTKQDLFYFKKTNKLLLSNLEVHLISRIKDPKLSEINLIIDLGCKDLKRFIKRSFVEIGNKFRDLLRNKGEDLSNDSQYK